MSKRSMTALMILSQVGVVLAAGDAAGASFFGSTVFGAALAVGVAAGGCGIGMGLLFASTIQGIVRQPELQSRVQVQMFIGFALIEAQVLYALFIGIILLYANPYGSLFK